MQFEALDGDGRVLAAQVAYSVGGGALLDANGQPDGGGEVYPHAGMDAILDETERQGLRIWEIVDRHEGPLTRGAADLVSSGQRLEEHAADDSDRPERGRAFAGDAERPTQGFGLSCPRAEPGRLLRPDRSAVRLRAGGIGRECRRRRGGDRADLRCLRRAARRPLLPATECAAAG